MRVSAARIARTARDLGITRLQAARHCQQQDALRRRHRAIQRREATRLALHGEAAPLDGFDEAFGHDPLPDFLESYERDAWAELS